MKIKIKVKDPYAHKGIWRKVIKKISYGFSALIEELECGHTWVGEQYSGHRTAKKRRCRKCLTEKKYGD